MQFQVFLAHFWTNDFLTSIFLNKNVLEQILFFDENAFWSNFFLTKNFFINIFFDQHFWIKKFFDKKYFDQHFFTKYFFDQKFSDLILTKNKSFFSENIPWPIFYQAK